MEKKEKENNRPTKFALDIIGDKWKILIVETLLQGTKRFGELKKELGDITQKVLTSNLKKLEEQGILIRKVYAQIPPKVEYKLTNLGKSLKPIIDSLLEWGAEYKEKMKSFIDEKIYNNKK